jgi:hypothetical protein
MLGCTTPNIIFRHGSDTPDYQFLPRSEIEVYRHTIERLISQDNHLLVREDLCIQYNPSSP